MAETEDRIDDGAPAQESAVPLANVAKQAKPSLRRRVIAPDQTALSSGLPTLAAGAPGGVQAKATTEVPVSAAVSTDVGTHAEPAPAPAAKSAKQSSPAKASVLKVSAAKTKPVAAKPLPVSKAAKVVAAKPLPPQHVAAPTKAMAAKPAAAAPAVPSAHQSLSAAKPAVATNRTALLKRAAPDTSPAAPAHQPAFDLKDKIMDMTANFSSFQDAISDAQTKAQAAFEKSSTVFGEVGEFAKGNVEAVIASGKILAEGAQEIGSTIVAEGRTAFESMTGDIKELAAAKSPTDFLKLQSDIVRKNFDSAVAYGSKNSETFLKLMNDAFAPISGRVSLAVEKARQAAPMNAAPVNAAAL
ncbi:phasin family protein [Novosphingobium sp. 9U]|uniref:phasin family protein n=1 Tax=Novosphingobium sp. 9U TaxID=2653158 RepID=UPI0012F3C84C|nr:phasin family protein [Novosphingobium sp. 9U]VWX53421.1 Phasin family protein [Novosphingobium sp. 9U]